MVDKLFIRGMYTLYQVPWKFRDIIIVTIIIYLSLFFGYPLFEFLTKSDKTLLQLFLYLGYLLDLLVPILWTRKFFKSNKNVLGITKGRWSTTCIITVGVITGFLCYLVLSFFWGPQLKLNRFIIDNLLYILISPFSIFGFGSFILGPFAEEVYFRGFLYAYLEKKVGVAFGLLIQALVFGLFHPEYLNAPEVFLIFQRILLGFFLGALFKFSASLYPSIICHGVVNFLYSIAIAQWH